MPERFITALSSFLAGLASEISICMLISSQTEYEPSDQFRLRFKAAEYINVNLYLNC